VKQKISLILFEEHKLVNYYSIVINGNKDCEMERFLRDMQSSGEAKYLPQIVNLLEKIGQHGAQERYFRHEGKRNDNVFAIPDHYLINSDYRLYCLRYGESIVVLGNGGVKKTKTYQEDQHLNECVNTLQKIDYVIRTKIASGAIRLTSKTISGETDFFI
jgi:hypothetical protein